MNGTDETPRTLTIDLTPAAWAFGDQLAQAASWSGDQCRFWLSTNTGYGDDLWRVFRPASLRRAVLACKAYAALGMDVSLPIRETFT